MGFLDRMLAEAFSCSLMHLHSTSMFLLDAFLEIEALLCFQINNDAVDIESWSKQRAAIFKHVLLRIVLGL